MAVSRRDALSNEPWPDEYLFVIYSFVIYSFSSLLSFRQLLGFINLKLFKYIVDMSV